ncbi:hypothetical protein [Candidatus Borreliella tachyglossi]|uniref:hypothetical protein n=1 Tax=Candidatus Borreliella tachyglossi TaxID=1964448 RepID=UPI0040424AAA
MRHHLLKTFDEIYIINLHGNIRKKEKTTLGTTDENIFDIMTGVCISIFIKYEEPHRKNELASVYYKSIKGSRLEKYELLDKCNISSINDFTHLDVKPPYYFFVNKKLEGADIYNKGISLTEIFSKYNYGIVTAKDKMAINFTPSELLIKLNDFASLNEDEAET